MLSKGDLEKIRQIIREELTIKNVTVERTNRETGAKEVKTIDLYLPEWIAAELPELAGALRGVQETADHAKNNSFKLGLMIHEAFQNLETNLKKSLSYEIQGQIESST